MAVEARKQKKVYFEEQGITKDHLLAFGDAIFVFAITLLVIEVKFPDLAPTATDADLINGILNASPAIVSYISTR